MAKHTPGPWKYTPSGDGYWITRQEIFVVGHGICGVKPSQSATEEQCLANACLISAAPDLLHEAEMNSGILQALETVLTVNAPVGFAQEKVLADIRARIKATDAAIAKAESKD